MSLSVFELFKVGIGPSSSHTVGPMWAAWRYLQHLQGNNQLNQTAGLRIHLFGSLALTGQGHATDKAVILGLAGQQPDQIGAEEADQLEAQIRTQQKLLLPNCRNIDFKPDEHITFHYDKSLPEHPNGMTIIAVDTAGIEFDRKSYFSVGGGFVLSEDQIAQQINEQGAAIPYPFESGQELLVQCKQNNLSIAELMFKNEVAIHDDIQQVKTGLDKIWSVMDRCINRGCLQKGFLPGKLKVKRRAVDLKKDLDKRNAGDDPLIIMDWVSLFAIAVNEENAAGGRVVTAPTNGAAGVIPAVLAYYMQFVAGANNKKMHEFLLTSAAIGILYKKNASISAAEVGCQGEIGVACSMAAAGLAAVMGGSVEQIENAAEIGMEHNLGMTCDPIAGLVQIPCIERNTMGAIKAINAARLALRGDGSHRVSLDEVIETMRQTGMDMQLKYKETALGGLAANVVLC